MNQPMYQPSAVNDSIQYKFFGLKNDLSSILAVMHMPWVDSAIGGYWRKLDIMNNTGTMNIEPDTLQKTVVPKATGLGLKDAVYLLENRGLRVIALGRGKVIFQSIPEGTNFNKGQTINITLN